MLDLENLEKKLEKVLYSETQESLLSWLSEKRLKTYLSSYGEGELKLYPKLNQRKYTIKVTASSTINMEIKEIFFYNSNDPKLAA